MEHPRPTSLFLSHGGGPGFLMKEGSGMMKQIDSTCAAAQWYRTFTKKWSKPAAIIAVSAHWEERGAVKVTTGAKHPLLFDYYGFPDYTYDLEYAPPGEPALASRIIDVLRAGGLKAKGDNDRGFDHGVFIPLKLMYPEADVPVVQVSLLAGLDSEVHLRIGAALGTLALEEDVLIVCSGQATHNSHSSYPSYPPGKGAPREKAFVDWLKETAASSTVTPDERRRRLREWETDAPHSRNAHPREEHLLPLHVAAGCAGFQRGEVIFDDFAMGGMSLACVGFWSSGSSSSISSGGGDVW
ncbi:unnamed protein product [Pylaiella littoralis]